MNHIRMCSPFHLKSSNLNIADEWKSLLSPDSWQGSHVSSMATIWLNQAPTVTEQYGPEPLDPQRMGAEWGPVIGKMLHPCKKHPYIDTSTLYLHYIYIISISISIYIYYYIIFLKDKFFPGYETMKQITYPSQSPVTRRVCYGSPLCWTLHRTCPLLANHHVLIGRVWWIPHISMK